MKLLVSYAMGRYGLEIRINSGQRRVGRAQDSEEDNGDRPTGLGRKTWQYNTTRKPK